MTGWGARLLFYERLTHKLSPRVPKMDTVRVRLLFAPHPVQNMRRSLLNWFIAHEAVLTQERP